MNLFISFSGGRTSAFMTKWMLDNVQDDYNKIIVVFANTGQENEETLRFVNQCDKQWGFSVVWVEAVVDFRKNKGVTHHVVDFSSASRKGEPYIEVIKKYGIPNMSYPHCNRDLKLAPLHSYAKELGWKKGSYETAIGIRIDEMDRVSSKMVEEKIIYPLVENKKMTKEMISIWWSKQSFNLNLKEHEGNCKWCWKKSKRKLLTLAKDTPEIFDFPMEMEERYGLSGHNEDGTKRVFFRNNKSTKEIIALSKLPFVPFSEAAINFDMFDFDMDSSNGCSDGCEVF